MLVLFLQVSIYTLISFQIMYAVTTIMAVVRSCAMLNTKVLISSFSFVTF